MRTRLLALIQAELNALQVPTETNEDSEPASHNRSLEETSGGSQ